MKCLNDEVHKAHFKEMSSFKDRKTLKRPSPAGIFKLSEVAQSCPTLCDPMDCSLPGCSVYGIFQARVLEWVTIAFSRGSS